MGEKKNEVRIALKVEDEDIGKKIYFMYNISKEKNEEKIMILIINMIMI